jgi:agmatinase
MKSDVRNDRRCGFDMITARQIDKIGVRGIVQRILDRVGGNRVYITVDIDVLDPAFAPGKIICSGWERYFRMVYIF